MKNNNKKKNNKKRKESDFEICAKTLACFTEKKLLEEEKNKEILLLGKKLFYSFIKEEIDKQNEERIKLRKTQLNFQKFQNPFYKLLLCSNCDKICYSKRNLKCDLNGKIALVTGGRIKAGFECCLKLLRNGATVYLTTRFANDAALRFVTQNDFHIWKNRLNIYGEMDFRDLKKVEMFCDYLVQVKLKKLDILINNANQKVSFQNEFENDYDISNFQNEIQILLKDYKTNFKKFVENSFTKQENESQYEIKLISNENENENQNQNQNQNENQNENQNQNQNKNKNQNQNQFENQNENDDKLIIQEENGEELIEIKKKDIINNLNNQVIISSVHEITTSSLLEAHAINTLAPFIFIKKLKRLMNSQDQANYIINVSTKEGKFYEQKVNEKTPHINMSKASLNMIIKTSAEDYEKSKIYMNCVDPSCLIKKKEIGKQTGIGFDYIESCNRILDPIFIGINTGVNYFGRYFKNYQSVSW
ncbi:oxidoreductase-like protein [Anaeramoeba ignava]|uniref:Oxidoreductase-like protein n=1 Tax=Anaeramoeba ignava TaxID=1746090 RepID=A0A9Q0LSP1_ANAIG|nr:oxidoreductase-like protein [Anaeramoeba ignava]